MKLIATLIISSTLLFSNSIVGAWTLDKEKAEKTIKSNAKNEMEQFVLGLMASTMIDMQFKEDGSCTLAGKSRAKCWEGKDDTAFTVYEENGKVAGNITLSNNSHFKLLFAQMGLAFEFTRVESSSMETPKIVMKKDKVYHAKNVKDEMFEKSGDGFLIFTGENEYYNLLSDGFNSFTVTELKAIIKKDKSDEGGFLLKKGAYSVNSGNYKVKNSSFYTLFNEKQIEVISPEQIQFNGYNYYLDEK